MVCNFLLEAYRTNNLQEATLTVWECQMSDFVELIDDRPSYRKPVPGEITPFILGLLATISISNGSSSYLVMRNWS